VQSYLSTATKWGINTLDAMTQLFTTGAWLPPWLPICSTTWIGSSDPGRARARWCGWRRLGGAAPAMMNRRIAAARGLFEFAVTTGARPDNPVPAARRSSGLRARPRGLLGHVGAGRPRAGGRLVRQPRRLPEALEAHDVAAFLADLRTSRDRAITLLMLLGGLRAEVRSLRLADVDMGLRLVRVTGKGGAHIAALHRHAPPAIGH
jgi:integrase/recombinase XerC